MSRLTLLSDVEIRIRSALQRSPIHRLRMLTVFHDGDSVRLVGAVESFYQKQLAQELVRPLAHGLEICNEVDVDW